jgi:glutamyl-tRNA(Gln) amidotransferase subunit E
VRCLSPWRRRSDGLSEELASQMVRSLNLILFEQIINAFTVSPTLVAVTLENTLVSLSRDGVPVESLKDEHFHQVFETISKSKISAEAIPDILIYLAKNPSSEVADAIEATGLGKVYRKEVESVIRGIVQERIDFVREQGERSVGGLMGVAMKELRGKADGRTIKDLLRAEVKRVLTR